MWQSRKFRTMICDAGFATLAIVLGWFFIPEKLNQVLILVGLWQPVIVSYIIGVAMEDSALKGSLSSTEAANTLESQTK